MVDGVAELAALAAPLEDAGDLDPIIERARSTRVVMLGEASHGTHEFYRWRALLTRRLIEECGYNFVAVEGDWPDCDRIDRVVRDRGGAMEDDPRAALATFERWPTWMWANEEVLDFCRWLREWNLARALPDRVGFHGLDLYSLWESLHEILTYLRERDPGAVPAALSAYGCFEPYGEDPQQYAVATSFVPEGCQDEVIELLAAARERAAADGADEFALWQNAAVVAGAEQYYRSMVAGGPRSWNVRDRHMLAALGRLLTHYATRAGSGTPARAVVWAHNTHVGDARGTAMADAGEVNLGQLAREEFGTGQVLLVGFGCHRGRAVAAGAWGGQAEAMAVPPARPGSLEALLHEAGMAAGPGSVPAERSLLVFPTDERPSGSPDERPGMRPGRRPGVLAERLGHRAIGVVYDPGRDYLRNYVPTVLGARYDAFCWFEETRPVHPLHVRRVDVSEEETYPTGV